MQVSPSPIRGGSKAPRGEIHLKFLCSSSLIIINGEWSNRV